MASIDGCLGFLSNALSQTDTRDSLTEIMQYSARIVAGTCTSQEIAARRVYKSLSEGRKIFRLLRFIPELRVLRSIDDLDPALKRLAISQSAAAVAFYVLDNWIYFLETVKRKSRGDIRPIKYIKNRVSLLRILISLFLTLAELHRELSQRMEPLIGSIFRGKTSTDDEGSNTTLVSLTVRLWHESLRLWLTLHKLHLLGLFLGLPAGKRLEPVILQDRKRYDILPGTVGLASAITAFMRKTILRRPPSECIPTA